MQSQSKQELKTVKLKKEIRNSRVNRSNDKKLRFGKKKREISDGKVSGLKVTITAKGGKYYYLIYTVKFTIDEEKEKQKNEEAMERFEKIGKRKKYRIETFGAITLIEARNIAKKLKAEIVGSGDPQWDQKNNETVILKKYLEDEYYPTIQNKNLKVYQKSHKLTIRLLKYNFDF